MPIDSFTTAGGVAVRRRVEPLADGAAAFDAVVARLDRRRGLAVACDVEQSGRYRPRACAFADPPLALTARGRELVVDALNARGALLLPAFAAALAEASAIERVVARPERVKALVGAAPPPATEEERLRGPSVFAALRALIAVLACDDPLLGLHGAFGYDLAFQLEPIALARPRRDDQRDLVLLLADDLVVIDDAGARRVRYDFAVGDRAGDDLPRDTPDATPAPAREPAAQRELPPGGYGDLVRAALPRFARGELFELVLSQGFARRCDEPPSRLFRRVRAANPAPYGFLANLGDGEFLVGASPEMFVRVAGRRVETCPISGTIARGADALEDAERARRLIASEKDEAELTMCTDVDRNDKARVCVPGSVRVVARRQIEAHARLLHTVDHVVGELADGRDALDALAAHAWAVTVTGAPKAEALAAIEAIETAPRRWYGGALGRIGADGSCDTGLVLRAARLADGVAEVRVGATLLHASDPAAEEAETELKASAVLAALVGEPPPLAAAPRDERAAARRVLLVDHRDSFVHTLADYLRRLGARVETVRAPLAPAALDARAPDLVVLSPGPGRPADFAVPATIAACVRRRLPVFGVCLGLQALVEWAGGELATLAEPAHGRASRVRVRGGRLFAGVPDEFSAGRYHSLHASRLPASLALTADADGVVMAVEHRTLALAGVQFHPESVLTPAAVGLAILRNVLTDLR